MSENSIEVVRIWQGREIRVRASYNEPTDDWNVISFDGPRIIEARATSNAWREIEDMIECALSNA